MSHALVNRIKPMTGLGLAEKSVLFQLADASHDGETVFLRMDRLTLYTGCSYSTARRALRKLERHGLIIPQGSTGGRGYVHVYRFNLDSVVESTVELTAEEVPPTNGQYPPQMRDDNVSPLQQKPNLTVYDDPYARKPGETATAWARRIDRLPPRR